MKKIIVLFSFLFLGGCAGLADYSIDLSKEYSLLRTSGNNITIVPKSDYQDGMWEENVIPSKVVEVGWDADYIIAKQQDYPKNEFYYWILNINEEYVEGPFILSEFQEKSIEYGISDLELKSVDDIK